MNKKKIPSLIAALIYISVIGHRMTSEDTEDSHKAGIFGASVLIVISLGLGISEKQKEGMKAGDYLQLISIFLALILLVMSIYNKWGFPAYTMLVGIVLISTTEFMNF